MGGDAEKKLAPLAAATEQDIVAPVEMIARAL
jgi:hypothetical protein